MTAKIVVHNLVKVFGPRPRLALERLKKGWTKKEILQKLGVRDRIHAVVWAHTHDALQ